jgi:glycine betaine/proline transport system substrate-binding protein
LFAFFFCFDCSFRIEFLGFPVEISANFSDFTGVVATSDMFPLMASGALDAALEVWGAGYPEEQLKYVLEERTVVNAGTLGLSGKIGWYAAPMLDSMGPSLEYWRSLTKSGNANLFADARPTAPCCSPDIKGETRDIFPCIPSEALGGTPVAVGGMSNSTLECDAGTHPNKQLPTYGGRFVAGAPGWQAFDEDLIRNLGLNFTVQYAGTEANLLAAVDDAVANSQPTLFYLWEPHQIFQQQNMTRMILPVHTSKGWEKAKSGGLACDYPTDLIA